MPASPNDDALPSSVSVLPHVPAQRNVVLFGPYGLRAGWSILLFLVSLMLLLWIANLVYTRGTDLGRNARAQNQAENRARAEEKRVHPSAPPKPALVHVGRSFPSFAIQATLLLLAAFGMAWLERRPFGQFGLGGFRWRHLLGGAVTGLAALSLLVGVLRALGVLVFDGRLLDGAAALRFGLLWLVFFGIIGLFEEFLYRGYLQYTLTRGLLGLGRILSAQHSKRAAFWLAAVLWSVLFLSNHRGNPGEISSGLAAVFVAGLVFSYALWRTGSLWWGIGFHMTWDWAESFLYGVPDSGLLSAGRLFSTHPAGNPLLSGGSAGPEGSLLVIPALFLVVLVLQAWPSTPPPLNFAQDCAPSKHKGLPADIVSGESIA